MSSAAIYLLLKKLRAYEPGIVRSVAIFHHSNELSALFDEPRKINGNTADFSAAISPVSFMQRYSWSDNAVHQEFSLDLLSQRHVVIFQTTYNKPYRKSMGIQISSDASPTISVTLDAGLPYVFLTSPATGFRSTKVAESVAAVELSGYLRSLAPRPSANLRALAISLVRHMDERLAVAKATAPVGTQPGQQHPDSFYSMTLYDNVLHQHVAFQGLDPFEYWPSSDEMDTDDEE